MVQHWKVDVAWGSDGQDNQKSQVPNDRGPSNPSWYNPGSEQSYSNSGLGKQRQHAHGAKDPADGVAWVSGRNKGTHQDIRNGRRQGEQQMGSQPSLATL
jgi:hypothetical protein